jgi:hypothetical protein
MGLFNDHQGPKRLEWTYKYTGKELLPYASKLYEDFRNKEIEARNRMADFMRDINVSNSDRRVEEVKREITNYGTLKEQCEVFKHEFARNPNQEYRLGLGDVTFFGVTYTIDQ